VKVPGVKERNKFTSSDLRGIFFTVEGIDQTHFDTLATKNFSSFEDVRTTLGEEPAVIVRPQDRLAVQSRIVPRRKVGSRNPATSQNLVRRRSRHQNRLPSRASRSATQRNLKAHVVRP
jgi:hypothetical protein